MRDRPPKTGTAHEARHVLPIQAPPLRDGAVVVENGRIVGLGSIRDMRADFPAARRVDHGEAILLPPLVNAHTHLALTLEAGKHPRGRGLIPWLESVVPAARAMDAAGVTAAIRAGLAASHRLGTGLLGEIASRPEEIEALQGGPAVSVRVFFEFLGVNEAAARRSFEAACASVERLQALGEPHLRPGLSPHAPYSVWPALWPEAAAAAARYGIPWTTHLAEPPSETEFLERGRGPLVNYLRGLGVWDGSFPVPGRAGAAFLDDLGILDERALLVHGVHLKEDSIYTLNISNTAVCLCPRSNATLSLPPPPIEALYHGGVFLCLGTDSAASNEDLGLWGEMRAVRRLAPTVPAVAVLRMATANGAVALGFSGRAGVLYPGGPGDLIAVDASGLGSGDPREYLLHEPVESRVRRL